MVKILKICGVQWKSRTDDIKNDGMVLDDLKKWATDDGSESLLGEDINEYMKNYELKTPFELERERRGDAAADQPYDWFSPSFDIMEGTIQNSQGEKVKVQLIIAISGQWDQSIFRLISMFYASHVRCIIGGWYICHMYYEEAKVKRSYRWKLNNNQNPDKVNAAIKKYEERRYTFVDPKERTIARSFNDKLSLFIDYSKMYSDVLGKEIANKYKEHIRERKYQLRTTTWVEDNGVLIPHFTDRSPIRQYKTFSPDTQAKAEEMQRQRLADDMAKRFQVDFESSTEKILRYNSDHPEGVKPGWGIPELAQSAISRARFFPPTPESYML